MSSLLIVSFGADISFLIFLELGPSIFIGVINLSYLSRNYMPVNPTSLLSPQEFRISNLIDLVFTNYGFIRFYEAIDPLIMWNGFIILG
jgi:hypothetical protein